MQKTFLDKVLGFCFNCWLTYRDLFCLPQGQVLVINEGVSVKGPAIKGLRSLASE